MADNYIPKAYAISVIGSTATLSAFFMESGAYSTTAFVTCGEMATALVQTYMRRAGYDAPATAGTAEDLKAITWAPFYEIACARPENSMHLPEDWQYHPSKVLFEDLKKGLAHLSVASSSDGAEGGVKFSETSTTVSSEDGSRRKVFRRDHFGGL